MTASSKNNYRATIRAARVGYIVQAAVNNFAPLLFLTFAAQYQLTLARITMITTVNFAVQLLVDLISTKLIDAVGYRTAIVSAHVFAAAGLAGLAFLPEIVPGAFGGILLAVVLYAVGGGIIEVMISPIVEACPTQNKEKEMSILHSFYSWGHAGIIFASAMFFRFAGIGNWRILACIWACLPAVNLFFFLRVPLYPVVKGERQFSLSELLRQKVLWLLLILMICSGAAEMAMAQWASAFFEAGTGLPKAVSDLAGPCMFAVCMGLARVVLGKLSTARTLRRIMFVCAAACVGAYLGAALLQLPAWKMAACAVCGFAVGIFWPGVTSLAGGALPRGGTAMYALLALCGDMGCTLGPTVVGLTAGAAGNDLNAGIGAAVLFPALALAGLLLLTRLNMKTHRETEPQI